MKKIKLNIQKFASGSFYLNKGTGDASWKSLQGRIDWTSVSNGSVENTSTVTTKLYGRTWTGGTSGRNWSGSVKVGSNSTHSFSKMDSSWADKEIAEDYVLFQTYTDTIKHNDDGTCSVTISGVLNGCTSTSLEGVTSSGSKTVTLDTIPRASEISLTDTAGNAITSATVGSTIRVNINRKSSGFKEKLSLVFISLDGDSQELDILKTSGDETDFITNTYYDILITENMFKEYFPGDANSITISATTYTAEGVKVLDTNSVSINIITPSTMIPTVTLGEIYDKGNIVPSDWGIFVKGKSNLYIPYTVAGVNNSIIEHTWLVRESAPGEQLTDLKNPLTGEFPIGIAKQNDTITVYTQDSRNKTANASKSFTVVDYTSPVLTTYTAQKVDADLNLTDSGEYVLFEIDGTIASCEGKNEKKKYIGFKSGSSINWIQITSEGATVLMDQPINPNQQNTIYFKIEDSLGESDVASIVLDSAFNLMNFNNTMTAVAIGKKSNAAADEKKFETGIPTRFIKGIKSKNPGNVNTQSVEGSLVVKRASNTSDENLPTSNGVVLEYSGWTGWGGQLYIADNGERGCYFNGWSDGVRSSWQKIIMKNDLLEMIYPVGSIYMSVENNSPQNFLGGTWTPLYDRMLVGAGNSYAVNSTGGSKDATIVAHTHTASIASSGAHYHTAKAMSSTGSTSGSMAESYAKYGTTRNIRIPFSGNDGAHTHTPTIDSTGVSATNANMPPYLGVYMWKRTA